MTNHGIQNLALLHTILRVENAAKCVAFYREKFGMSLLSTVKGKHDTVHELGFVGEEGSGEKYRTDVCLLELVSPNTPSSGQVRRVNHGEREGVYWKIAVHLADVDEAIRCLRTQQVKVGDASQFRDIGYLAHLSDPDDYAIELLQHTFADSPLSEYKKLTDHPLHQQPSLGLITLRVSDIEANLQFYRDILGMKLICREDVSAYNFVLYFLGFTSEDPPNATDLDAVENREWLYQRSYPILELQVIGDGEKRKFAPLDCETFGFMGMGFGCSDVVKMSSYLKSKDVAVTHEGNENDLFGEGTFSVQDPQGIPIRFIPCN